MSKAKQSVKRYWKRYIEEFKTSGMSKVAYCRTHELVYHQFLYWYDKFTKAEKTKAAKLSLQRKPVAKTESLASPFVPIKLQPDDKIPDPILSLAPKPITTSSNLLCTFEMQQGHKILVYSIAALERVLPLLNANSNSNDGN